MITKEQIDFLVRKNKINETVIFREYLQLLFLNNLYNYKQSKGIYFKGGTALHLIYKAPRFSEDLDFTVTTKEQEFSLFIKKLFTEIVKKEAVFFREKKTIAGKRFVLFAKIPELNYETFVNLDFSFREKVLEEKKSIIETDFPVVFTSYIYHLSMEEMFAEKIRALLTRKQGRDLYDIWYLLTQECALNKEFVQKKLKYYNIYNVEKADILKRIKSFSKKDFILDLRPFVPIPEREKLESFFEYTQEFVKNKI